MNKFIISVAVVFAALVAGAQTHVIVDLEAFGANPATNRYVTYRVLQPWEGNPVRLNTGTNTWVGISNVAVADYECTIERYGSAPAIPFQFTVTATDTGVLQADDITSQVGIRTYPETGRASWTIKSSESRYGGSSAKQVAAGAGITTETNSNLVTVSANLRGIGAGSNITIVTNGAELTISSSGGGGSGETNFLASVGEATSLVAEKAANTNQVKSLAVSGGLLSISSTESNVTVALPEANVLNLLDEFSVLRTGTSNDATLNGAITINSTLNVNDFLTGTVGVFSGNITSTGGNIIGDGSLLTALNAGQLGSGTIPPGRFPAILPAVSGTLLTSLNANVLDGGTIPDARFPASISSDITGNAATATIANNLTAGATVNPVNLNAATNLAATGLADGFTGTSAFVRSNAPNIYGATLHGTSTAQTVIATNLYGNGGGLTNVNAVNSTNVFGIGARHVNSRDYYHLWSAIHSNAPVRFLVVGDSVANHIETTRGVRYALDGWMSRGGYGTGYTENQSEGTEAHLLWYQSGISASAFNPGYAPGSYYPFSDSEVSTWQSQGGGITANQLTIYYMGGPELGSFLVETQRNGGSWGTRTTVDASILSAGTMAATNFVLSPLTNYNVRITSTGSNNIVDVGLLDTTATNSHAWAKVTVPGQLLREIVTNANFSVLLTNFNPQVVFVEAKDPAADIVYGLSQLSLLCTNRDLVIIANGPNLPDEGALASREITIEFGQTNKLNVFDKYGILTPTNYWYGLLPITGGTTNFYNDGAHLGFKGIQYVSSAFANWFGVSSDRFGMAGIYPRTGIDISAKANLTGGNAFSGDQTHGGAMTVSNVVFVRGSLGQFGMYAQNGGADVVRLQRSGTSQVFNFAWSAASEASMLVLSNISGASYLDANSVYPVRVGHATPWAYWRQTAAKSTNYTAASIDEVLVFNNTSLTFTLPSAVTMRVGKSLTIKNLHSTALTVARTSSQTIDGAASDDSLVQYESVTYTSDGANWVITSRYLP
jgi:hypothetical protein